MKSDYKNLIRFILLIPAIVISILIFFDILTSEIGFPIFFLLFGVYFIFDGFCPLHPPRLLSLKLKKIISIIVGFLFILLSLYGFFTI